MENTAIAPTFPVFEIGGRKLTVKFDSLARFRMSALGITNDELRTIRRVDNIDQLDPRILSVIVKLFSCAVANNFINLDDPGAPARIPSPEYWAAVIDDERWKDVVTVIMTAYVKASPPMLAPPSAESDGAKQTTN